MTPNRSSRITEAVALAGLILLFACRSSSAPTAADQAMKGAGTMAFTLQSSAFQNGGSIPKKFTCEAADVSPELTWSGAPEKTQSFALIADDPDAPMGSWVHWVIYDLPANTAKLPEGVPNQEQTADGAQGKNSSGKIGYGGPCPPPGKPHRYFFKLYALDSKLNLKPGARKPEVEAAMKGHVLAQAELMGKYGR